ncbi:M24 family metallopeptidase [Sphingomonas sp.]|uniref:M24 family metallopeptidase n=1 Tax=Sphingomonas sp. TaxID=28214 RepID=UPI0025EEACDF|nr:M24 family metallopeptidase [Sphingomonas sp.]
MATAGIDVLVTAPNPGFWDQLQAHGTYLSSVGGNNAPVAVVFPRSGEVTAIVGPVPSREFWLAWQSWVSDVRATHWAVGDGVIDRLGELDSAGRIGLPGLIGSPRFPDGLVPSGFLDKIRAAFPASEIVDATALLDDVRATKSAEERAAVAEAIGLAEAAFDLLLAEARPGIAERVVYGRMVGNLIENGAIPTNFLMWSAGTNFGYSLAPFPTGSALKAGEPLYCEIEARSPAGYLGQITRMACLGAPSDNLRRMFDDAAETFEGVLASMTPGVTMREVIAVYKEYSAASRYDLVPVIHTRALGEDRPMIVYQTDDPAILAYEIREHHIYAVKVQVRDKTSGEMAFWGESVAIGSARAEQLGTHDISLPIIP